MILGRAGMEVETHQKCKYFRCLISRAQTFVYRKLRKILWPYFFDFCYCLQNCEIHTSKCFESCTNDVIHWYICSKDSTLLLRLLSILNHFLIYSNSYSYKIRLQSWTFDPKTLSLNQFSHRKYPCSTITNFSTNYSQCRNQQATSANQKYCETWSWDWRIEAQEHWQQRGACHSTRSPVEGIKPEGSCDQDQWEAANRQWLRSWKVSKFFNYSQSLIHYI